MSLSVHVRGNWPTNNHLLDMARKSGARMQERKARSMGKVNDAFNDEIQDWKLQVKAAFGRPLSEFAKHGPFVAVVVQAGGENRRDADSSGMAAKFAIDALMPKDHGLCAVCCLAGAESGLRLTFIAEGESAAPFKLKNGSALVVGYVG